MHTVTITLTDSQAKSLQQRTGKRSLPAAVKSALSEAEAPPSRLSAAFEALRADAAKKHPNGMTPAQIRALIQQVRSDREAAARRA